MWYQTSLSVLSSMITLRLHLTFFLSSVWLLTDAYLSRVWSKFMISDAGIWYQSAISIILWWKRKPAFLMALSGIFGLPVVAARLTNLILQKRLLAHSIFSKSIHLRCSYLLCSVKVFAVAMATTLFTMPPFFRNTFLLHFLINFINKKQRSTDFSLWQHLNHGQHCQIFQYWLVLGTEGSNGTFPKFQVWMYFFEFSYSFCWNIHRCVFLDEKTRSLAVKRIISAFAFYR